MIHTVLGPVSAEDLGSVLIHEHITCADLSMRYNFGSKYFDPARVTDLACSYLREAMSLGIDTLVDGSAVNLGRDIHLLREVSRRTGMHLIASSGFYFQQEPWLSDREASEITDLLLEECLCGIGGTDSRPGIMKAAVGRDGLTEYHKKLLSATARAGAAAGLPLFCHHEVCSRCGPGIADLAEKNGLDPTRVVLGHSGDSEDPAYLEELFQTGCYIGFDRMGYYGDRNPVSLETVVSNILRFCEKGCLKQILISHDLAPYLGFWGTLEEAERAYENGTTRTFAFFSRRVLPMLRTAGLEQTHIETIIKENPARLLSVQKRP